MLQPDLFPTAVYRLFDGSGRLLYIGMGDGRARLKSHLRSKPWRHDIDQGKTVVAWFDTRAEAAAAETEAIQAERPAHNVVHRPRPSRAKDTDANKRRVTPRRQIALSGDLWDRLRDLHGERGRSEVIRALVEWHLRKPGAKLPERPPLGDWSWPSEDRPVT